MARRASGRCRSSERLGGQPQLLVAESHQRDHHLGGHVGDAQALDLFPELSLELLVGRLSLLVVHLRHTPSSEGATGTPASA